MVWRTLLLLLFISPLFGESDFFAFDSVEPSAIHLGQVNAITGGYVESEVDIRVRSVAPLAMQRRFSSADSSQNRYAKGWWIHELKADWSNGDANHKGKPRHDKCEMSLSHPEHGRLHYLPVKDPELGWRVQRFKSICNTGSGEISGRTNLRTVRVGFAGHPCFDWVRGDGEIARYYFNAGGENDFYKKEAISGHLCSRTLPNGYFLDYFQDEVKAYNCPIKEKQQLLGSLTYREVGGGVEVTSSDGQRAKLAIDGDRHLRRVEVDGRPWVEYDYLERSNQPVGGKSYLCMRRGPEDRFLEIRYYFNSMLGFGERWTRPLPDGSFAPDPALGRVSSLWAPVGRDGSSAMMARFDYTFHFFSSVGVDFNGGVTTVYDNDGQNGDGNRTVYHYDVGLRPTEIVHEQKVAHQAYKLLSRVRYQYSQESATEGDLIGKVIYEGKEPIAATTFEYDGRGNLLCQRVYGNLTGGCSTPIQLQKNGLRPVENGVESYAIWQVVPGQQGFYSTPHSNLVVERREGERVTLTRYREGTDLIAAQLVKADGKIQQRLFNRYDENHVLIERIEDDGSGTEVDDLTDVHVRTICRIRPVASGTAIGFPERVERWYWDGSQERLLSAVEHRYNDQNLPIEADTYDANGEYRYTLYNEYDLGGRLTRQIDAMGFEHRFEYDIHGNLTAELDSRSGSRHFYDLANRRIRTDRADQSTHYRYDLNSRCIEEENWLGHTVERSYDALGRVTQDRTHSYEYNSQGGITCETDPRGFKTLRKFNARNQPIQVDYPDGTSESFRYDLAGREVFRKRRDGVSLRSSYDGMDRLIQIEEGEKVSTFIYCGDRIVSSCDPMGLVRSYGYDGAGRLISERWGDCRREYLYDAMGRRCETRDWFGLGEEEYRSSIELYDDLNRLTEEIEQDRRITHEYDPSGNEIGVTTYGEDGVPERTTTEYDLLDRPIRIVDPLGHMTVIEYLNEEIRTTDPLGHITIERKDAFDRTISVEQLDRLGQRISFVSMSYDPAGNCIEERYALLSPSKSGELTTRREFDPAGRLILLIEPDGKQTHFIFNDLGQLISRVDPNGCETRFKYDGFNRLLLESSENLTYSYEYDLSDRLIASTGTKLIYNEVGHLVCEEEASGLSIRYECDLLGRRTKVILPDDSEIRYAYDGDNLRQVSRGSYAHDYLEFDLSGRSLLERNIGGEEIRRRWDEAGRLIELDSPTYVASLDYDAVGNLTHLSGRDGEGRFSQSYSYDALYQIVSEEGHSYAYDSLNNRIDCDGEPYEYDEGNQLIKFGSTEFSYDDLGNLSSRSDRSDSYRFDDRNRLIEVISDGTVYRYTYDSFDRRISKSWATRWSEGSVTYLYDGMNEIAQVDSNGLIEQLRVLGCGVAGDIGAIVALELFGETITPVTNHRGDLVGLMSSSGDTFENGLVL